MWHRARAAMRAGITGPLLLALVSTGAWAPGPVPETATQRWAGIAGAQQESADPPGLRYEYATEQEALTEAFPEATEFLLQRPALDEATRAALAERLRRPVPSQAPPVYLVYGAGGRFLGYGVVAEEIGKHRPITFLVALEPDLAVREVQVLVYRESRGGEVRHRRFLRQFRGARPEEPLRVGREILNITGATMSVRAITAGVRRVQATVAALYSAGAPELAAARASAAAVLRPKRQGP